MYRVRPVRKKDIDALFQLAQQTGGDLVSLYPNADLLKKKIVHSIASFSKQIKQPYGEQYSFILEDFLSKKIVGTTAIHTAIGSNYPYTSFKIIKKAKYSPQINVKTEYDQLLLVNDHQGQTEICSLYLDDTHRGKKLGELLSRSRFLFMAQFPDRFSRHVIASMRGLYDKGTGSPFWNGLGKKFISISMDEATRLEALISRQFIVDLLPHQAIPIPLLSKSVQKSIAQVHPSAKPARHILEKEGFAHITSIHPIDGGPFLEANIHEIKTIQSCHLARVKSIIEHTDEQAAEFLVSNCKLQFYATYGKIIQDNHNSCIINKELALHLQIKRGDMIRFVPI